MSTKQVEYPFIPAASAPDAIEKAKGAARDEGFTVVTVCRVIWAPQEDPYRPGWSVTLSLRPAKP